LAIVVEPLRGKKESNSRKKMADLHASTEERVAAVIATRTKSASQEGLDKDQDQLQNNPRLSAISSENDDDELDLLKLGYKSVLARGWGAFDNFACSFSALYCIGGIRVLFYIALSAGGPAALYVYQFVFQENLLICEELN
jgi:hypothetical protein